MKYVAFNVWGSLGLEDLKEPVILEGDSPDAAVGQLSAMEKRNNRMLLFPGTAGVVVTAKLKFDVEASSEPYKEPE